MHRAQGSKLVLDGDAGGGRYAFGPVLDDGLAVQTMTITHRSRHPVTFDLEIDFDATAVFHHDVALSTSVTFRFPEGLMAHWCVYSRIATRSPRHR